MSQAQKLPLGPADLPAARSLKWNPRVVCMIPDILKKKSKKRGHDVIAGIPLDEGDPERNLLQASGASAFVCNVGSITTSSPVKQLFCFLDERLLSQCACGISFLVL